jgi:hypothetical protein
VDLHYSRLLDEIEKGTLRATLERELTEGFQRMHAEGDALPPASYYAARISEIIERNSEQPLSKEDAFNLYQEVVIACDQARRNVLGDEAEEQREEFWK